MSPRVGIVGGGISGLATARELRRRGLEVVVHEASSAAGGLLGTESKDGFVLERAASSVVPAERGAIELAGQLGVPLDEASENARNRWVFVDGELRVLPTGPKQLVTSSLMTWRGKVRALTEPFQPTHLGADESIAEFSRRRLGEEVTRSLIGPMVTGVFAGNAEELSLRACFPKLARLEARGGLVRGLAATRIEAFFSGGLRRSGSRKIRAPRGGMRSLVEALAREAGDSLRLSSPVASLELDGGRFVLHLADGRHDAVDRVVLATPASVAASLVEPHATEMATALRQIPYVPVAVVGLGFAREHVEHALDGFGFLVAEGEELRVLGVVFESTVWPDRAPKDHVLIRCIMGGARDPELLGLSDPEIVGQAVLDLQRTLGVRGAPVFQRVVRWPRGIPQYTIGHLDRLETIEREANKHGLALVGNPYHGVSVNDCVANGSKVAELLARQLTTAAVALLALGLLACGAPKQRAPDTDGGKSRPSASGDSTAIEIEADPTVPANLGKASVKIAWQWPPARLRRSPGRNGCGAVRPAPLDLELMGGLRDAVLQAPIGLPPGDAAMSIDNCLVTPRVVVVGAGRTLVMDNRDQRAHQIVVRRQGGQDEPRHLPMRIIGHTYEVPLAEVGIYEIFDDDNRDDVAYAVVTSGAAAVTDQHGVAELSLPVGKHMLEAWHPPVPARTGGSRALAQKLELEIVAGKKIKHAIELADQD